MKLTFLHLSDLHLADSVAYDQNAVLKALYADIASHVENKVSFTGALFTGDLVAKGDYSAPTITRATTEVVPNILAAAQLPPDRFFVVPGNHDVETKKRNPILEPVFDKLTTREAINDLIDKANGLDVLLAHLASFRDLQSSLVKSKPVLDHPLFTCHVLNVDGYKVGLACLNSAWNARGLPDNVEHGKLLLGERQVEMSRDALKECHLRVAMMHHPASWLSLADNGAVQRALTLNFHALLFGHNHEPDAAAMARANSTLFLSNAGCLYQSRDYVNGYSILQYDTEQAAWTVKTRQYYQSRDLFDKCVGFAEDGVAVFRMATDHGASRLLVPSPEYTQVINAKLQSLMLISSVSDIAPKEFNAFFVEPVLSRISQRQAASSSDRASARKHAVAVRDLLSSEAVTIVLGRQESGRTTLLAYCCSNAANVDVSTSPRFGTYVDLDGLKTISRTTLLEAITTFGGGEYKRRDFIELLKAGRMFVCFDSLPLDDAKTCEVVDAFVREFPRSKFLISASETLLGSITSSTLPQIGGTTQTVYLHSFGRKQTRELASKWFGGLEVTPHVEATLQLIERLKVPRTPFLVTVTLWLQERKVPLDPVNQAALIDTFLDGLLEKFYESKSRRHVDATIKRHFLGEFAVHLYKSESLAISRLAVDDFAVNYFKAMALPGSPMGVVQELLDKGILYESSNEVRFKFECFRSFFLASRLESVPTIYQDALSIDKFHNLVSEIDLFTGHSRDKHAVLERFVEILAEAHGPVALELSPEVLDDIGNEGSPLSAEKREMIVRQLLPQRPSPAERERMLDEIQEEDRFDGGEQPAKRVFTSRQFHLQPYGRFLNALRVCSMVLRNSELVADVELKRRAYAAVLRMWCEVLIGLVLAIDLNDAHEELDALGDVLDTVAPQHKKHMAKMIVPTVVFAVVREMLGTPKLELVMTDHLATTKYSAEKLIDTFLFVDLEMPGYIKRLQALTEDIDSPYELELIFTKALSVLFMRELSSSQATAVEQVIADVFSKLNRLGVKLKDDAQRRAFLTRLESVYRTEKFKR